MRGKIQIIKDTDGKFEACRRCTRIQDALYAFESIGGFPGKMIRTDTAQEMRDRLASGRPIVWA